MEKDFKNMSNEELLELYKRVTEFEKWLKKDFNEYEKMRDTNEYI